MERSLHQLYKKILDFSLAVAQAQEAFLKSSKAGDVLGYIETDDLSKAMQELNHSQAVCEGCAREHHTGNTRQLWQGLVDTKSS